jgi:hypothetical protein
MNPEECTPETVRQTLVSLLRRCEAARLAGGMAAQDVADGIVVVPEGWEFDWRTEYYIPPSVALLP